MAISIGGTFQFCKLHGHVTFSQLAAINLYLCPNNSVSPIDTISADSRHFSRSWYPSRSRSALRSYQSCGSPSVGTKHVRISKGFICAKLGMLGKLLIVPSLFGFYLTRCRYLQLRLPWSDSSHGFQNSIVGGTAKLLPYICLKLSFQELLLH